MDKLLSVIIPTYDRKSLTDRAISSVICKYPSLVEIVVIDDCSPSPYFYNGFNASNVAVRVIRLDSNVGAGIARKIGVAHTSTRFIAFLDSDDIYDPGWIDYVLALLQSNNKFLDRHILISGATKGEKKVSGFVRTILVRIPPNFQLMTSQIVATIFNPFYTPSIVLSKELCFFMDGLRYCEDYYSIAFSLFEADQIFLPPVIACHLGRVPNSEGGASAEKEKMFSGEMKVRFAMLKDRKVPLSYKVFVLLGMVYQYMRSIVKKIYYAIQ